MGGAPNTLTTAQQQRGIKLFKAQLHIGRGLFGLCADMGVVTEN